jgi:beta-phosphoglucomutase
VDGTEVSRGKPAPEAFLLAAERLGLPPEECMVLEDAAAGVEAARRAAMGVVGIGRSALLADAMATFEDLASVTAEGLLGGCQP